MKRLALALFITVAFTAFSPAQAPPAATSGGQSGATVTPQSGQTPDQMKQDQSQCMAWAKQQVGLGTSGGTQTSEATNQAAANPPAKPSTSTTPESSSKPETPAAEAGSAASGTGALASGAAGMAGKLGSPGNSQAVGALQDAYKACLEKKGYTVK